jgi:competence protein ComFC
VVVPAAHTPLLHLLHSFVDFVVPPVCFHCGVRRSHDCEALCAACWNAVTPVMTGEAYYRNAVIRLCGERVLDGLTSLWYFEKGGPLQSLLHELKYGGKPSLGVRLGVRLAPMVREDLSGRRCGGLVPVPLHAAKVRERGYNQSERIAEGISRVLGIPVLDFALRRYRYTASQTTLGVEERMVNVAGAFVTARKFHPEDNAIIVLVDDVITSGATVMECARTLKHAGVSHVAACSVALAL